MILYSPSHHLADTQLSWKWHSQRSFFQKTEDTRRLVKNRTRKKCSAFICHSSTYAKGAPFERNKGRTRELASRSVLVAPISSRYFGCPLGFLAFDYLHHAWSVQVSYLFTYRYRRFFSFLFLFERPPPFLYSRQAFDKRWQLTLNCKLFLLQTINLAVVKVRIKETRQRKKIEICRTSIRIR